MRSIFPYFPIFPSISRQIPSRKSYRVWQNLLKPNNLEEVSMAQRKLSLPEFGFVRLPQILACIPVCESAWWEGCRTGRYPKPVKIGPRTTAWRVEDIKELIERLGKGEGNGK